MQTKDSDTAVNTHSHVKHTLAPPSCTPSTAKLSQAQHCQKLMQQHASAQPGATVHLPDHLRLKTLTHPVACLACMYRQPAPDDGRCRRSLQQHRLLWCSQQSVFRYCNIFPATFHRAWSRPSHQSTYLLLMVLYNTNNRACMCCLSCRQAMIAHHAAAFERMKQIPCRRFCPWLCLHPRPGPGCCHDHAAAHASHRRFQEV